MLTHLCLRDFLLFEQVSLPVQEGFTAITGETGAGKSILLLALHLVTGGRLDKPVVRPGAAEAVIIAEFNARLPWLTEQGIASDEGGLILKRIVSEARTSRAFINDQPVSLKLLREVGSALLDLHGQHDTLSLLEPAQHRVLLDSALPDNRLLAAVRSAYQAWQDASKGLADWQQAMADARAEEDYWRLALAEFTALNPSPGEDEALASERQRLLARQKETQSLHEALAQIADIPSRPLHWAADTLKAQAAQDASLQALAEMLTTAAINLEEAQHDLAQRLNDDDGVAAELERIDQRWHELKALTRKYRLPLADLPRLFAEAKAKVDMLESGVLEEQKYQQQVKATKQAYNEAAAQLTAARQTTAAQLTKALNAELAAVMLPKARFAIEVSPDTDTAHGADSITFLIQTNPGHAPAPLHKVASGGEMARVMLAFKVVLATRLAPTTLIFDEVDTGVSGQVATAIGQRLRALSTARQVLCITHAPQVASLAGTHWKLSKRQASKTTTSTVMLLSAEERREELARMLAGQTITGAARAAADALLEPANA